MYLVWYPQAQITRSAFSMCFAWSLGVGAFTRETLFFSLLYVVVQSLGVASQTGERVKIAIFVAKVELLEIRVAVLGRILHFVVEHPNLLAIQYFDAAYAPDWKLVEVKTPVLIAEESVALTNAAAFCALCCALATRLTVCN
jgi:hypothetical protein